MGRGFNSQIIRREKSEIVQIVRPTVVRLRKKKPACLLARSLALSFAFARSPLPRRLHARREQTSFRRR